MILYGYACFCMILYCYVWLCIVTHDSIWFCTILIIDRHYALHRHWQFDTLNQFLCAANKTVTSECCWSTPQTSDSQKPPQTRRCGQGRTLPLGARPGQTRSHHNLVTSRPARSLAVQSQTSTTLLHGPLLLLGNKEISAHRLPSNCLEAAAFLEGILKCSVLDTESGIFVPLWKWAGSRGFSVDSLHEVVVKTIRSTYNA
jgi:hypothetical protein